MPPPKKPKSGRTSLEQFLSDEERPNPLSGPRSQRDSEGHSLRESEGGSPVGSVADFEGSDVEVFDATKETRSSEMDMRINLNHEQLLRNQERDNLLHKLFRKTHSIDEQTVPGSPDRDMPSPTSSPTSDPDRVEEFNKFEEHVKMRMERKYEVECESYPKSPNEQIYGNCDMEKNADMSDTNLNPQAHRKITSEQGRLIDTLVASALASTAAQSIIYAQRPVHSVPRSFPNFPHGDNVSHNTMKNYDSEPRDLSKRSEINGKLLDHRLYENLHNTIDTNNPLPPYHGWTKEVTVERNKHYLDSHRQIVELLSARDTAEQMGKDITPVQIMEKENIVQSVPARYPNGFFHTVGLNGVLGNYSRYEHHQRESLERTMGKMDDSGSLMSAGSYMPVHSMMPPTTTAGQSPTSTTMDLTDPRDRFHPAFMNPHLMIDSRRINRDGSHGNNVNKLCQVCSDNASGFHYGVWSCEGCKAFFKRSIQGPVDYVCPATNTCTIDKHRRKSCQACRLRKCYEVGMNKGSQRKDRKSSGASPKCPKRPRLEDGVANINGGPTPVKNSRKSRASIILEALGKADLPNLESYHNHSLPPTRVHLLNSLVKLAERELVFLINWAKNVPGYTDLSLGDQVHLIECCWMELLLLNCAFRSMEHGGRRLAFAPDLVLERPYWSTVGMVDVLEQVGAVSEQMVQYNLHREELLLLQATVLANAEVRKLASYKKLHEIQQNLLDSLVDIAQKYHPDNLRHIPSILLLLTHIRQAAGRATAYFQSLKKEGSVNFCDLLTEMLDAQSEDKISQSSS